MIPVIYLHRRSELLIIFSSSGLFLISIIFMGYFTEKRSTVLERRMLTVRQ